MISGLSKLLYTLHFDIPFSKKLNRIYLGIFIVPLILINFLIIFGMSTKMREQISYAVNMNFQQTLDHLEAYISSYDTLAFNLSRIDDLQYLYQNRNQLDRMSANDFYIARTNLFTKIHTVISRSKNMGFSFFLNNELNILANNETYFSFDDIANEIWFTEMIRHFNANRRSFLLCPPGWIQKNRKSVISFFRTIFSRDNYWALFGFVKLDMPLDDIINILKKNITVAGTGSYILNYEQKIIASSGERNELNIESIIPYTRLIPSSNGQIKNLSGKNYMIWQAPIGEYHLNLVTIIPVSAISSQSLLFSVIMLVSLLVLSLGTSYVFRKEFSFLTERIQLIIRNMQATNDGTLSTISRRPEKDEVGQLIANYNKMVENLKTIIDDNNRNNIELKNYELQILWEQINPHFLYNNLEMINWLAKNEQNEKVILAVNTLALFYQAALSGGIQKVLLSRELEYVRTYINLQNMRFENVLNYKCDIQAECESLWVPRTILQPIIENSIIHGILEKETGSGTITIRIKTTGELLLITIEDDGIGMSPEMIDKLNEDPYIDASGERYGIKNVTKRIKLMYGSDFGLFFRSDMGKGTCVTIRLPPDRNSPVKNPGEFVQ